MSSAVSLRDWLMAWPYRFDCPLKAVERPTFLVPLNVVVVPVLLLPPHAATKNTTPTNKASALDSRITSLLPDTTASHGRPGSASYHDTGDQIPPTGTFSA